MPLIAITRAVSPSINNCALSFRTRESIDLPKAIAQHKAYQDCLTDLGVHVLLLPAEPNLPDAVFVEDPAVVLDELAIICNMGVASRRPEANSIALALSSYRPIKHLQPPATLEGGDVMRISRSLFVGLSLRTNPEALRQLGDILRPYDYTVQPIDLRGCLHLKSGCSYIGDNSILINRSLVDPKPFRSFELIDVPLEEPTAANALLVSDVVMIPASFPRTRALLEERGFSVKIIDVSELQKAEGGVTCTSLIFNPSQLSDNSRC